MPALKTILSLFFIGLVMPLFASEEYPISHSKIPSFNIMQYGTFSDFDDRFSALNTANTGMIFGIDLFAVQKKDVKKTVPKITLTSFKIAAIVMVTLGALLILTGAGLLIGSLVYSNFLETNEKDYDKYVTGKNLSRGLFYGSIGAFGTGTVCIVISIPLFVIDPKKIPKTKTKTTTKKKK
jgi:hypothetical protein